VYNFGDSVFKELISCLSVNDSSFEISSYCAQKCGDTAERLEVYISDVMYFCSYLLSLPLVTCRAQRNIHGTARGFPLICECW
jgi:hypothetical protein